MVSLMSLARKKLRNSSNEGRNRRPAIIKTVDIRELLISYDLIRKMVHFGIETLFINKMSADEGGIEKGGLAVLFS